MSLEPPPSAVDKFTNHWRQWFSRVFTYVKSIDLTGAITDNSTGTAITIRSDNDVEFTGGIYIGGTATANLLDDYEEGTWTPVLTGSTSGTVNGSGTYTKAGRLVHLYGESSTPLASKPIGNYTITGMAFPNLAGDSSFATCNLNRVTYTDPVHAYVASGGSVISLYQLVSNSTAVLLTDANFVNAATMHVRYHLVYHTAL